MNEPNVEGFKAAWSDSETLVYPECPCEHGQRWFVRTEGNPTGAGHLLLIGMNPSAAKRLAPESQGGDKTTTKICAHINFSSWKRVTLVNLSPIRSGNPSDLDPNEVLKTHSYTQEIIRTVFPQATKVLLMWGNPEDTEWKEPAIANLKKVISQIGIDPEVEVIGFPSSNKAFPCHPGFGGLDHWNCKTEDGHMIEKKPINFRHLLDH